MSLQAMVRMLKRSSLGVLLLLLLVPASYAQVEKEGEGSEKKVPGQEQGKDKEDKEDKEEKEEKVEKKLPAGFLGELQQKIIQRKDLGTMPVDEKSAQELDARRQIKENATILPTDSYKTIAQKMGKMALNSDKWQELLRPEDKAKLGATSKLSAMIIAAQAYAAAGMAETNPVDKADMHLSAAIFYRYVVGQLSKVIKSTGPAEVKAKNRQALLGYAQEILYNLSWAKVFLLMHPTTEQTTNLHKRIAQETQLANDLANTHTHHLRPGGVQGRNAFMQPFNIQFPFIDDTSCRDLPKVEQQVLCLEIEHGLGDRPCPNGSPSSLCQIIHNAKTKNCSYLEALGDVAPFKQCQGLEKLILTGKCPEGDKTCALLQLAVGFPITSSCQQLATTSAAGPEAAAACLGARHGLGLTKTALSGVVPKDDRRLFMVYSCEDARQRNLDFRIPIFKSIQELNQHSCQICRQEGCEGCDDMEDSGSFAYSSSWGNNLWQKIYAMNFKMGLDRSDLDLMYMAMQTLLSKNVAGKLLEVVHQSFVKNYMTFLRKQYKANDLRQMFLVGKTVYDEYEGVAFKKAKPVEKRPFPLVIRSGFRDDHSDKMYMYYLRNEENIKRFPDWKEDDTL